jgi:hypothetical protein
VSVRVLASAAFGDAGLLGGAAAFPSVNAVADVVFHGKRLAVPVRFGGEQRSPSSSWYRQSFIVDADDGRYTFFFVFAFVSSFSSSRGQIIAHIRRCQSRRGNDESRTTTTL